ncbi:MAG: hypothetical protein HW387_185 [Parachlamydiales bacterium]|nr:hypothetical protein [Parachlamydiales bacterium]
MIFFRMRHLNFNIFDSKRNLVLLVVFLLMFPKGGIKIHDIPLTWGYFLLGLFSIGALLRKTIIVHQERLHVIFALIPFLIIGALTMAINGVESLGMAVSFWISFLFLPFMFFCLFSKDIETFNEQLFFHLFVKGIFFIAIYGIALFVIKQVTGHFLEIPLLTMNLGDLGQLETKHINRGFVFKLISTYNNGNLYGICLLMLLPLFCFLEKTRWRHWIVKMSLLLTFSRTVWIGLFFHELCYQWFINKNKKTFFLTLIVSLILIIGALAALSAFYGFDWRFFTDTNLGGRRGQLDAIFDTGFFSPEPFNGFSEIVYAGMIFTFGWAGLVAFLFAMGAPLVYQIISRHLPDSHKCIALGLINYLFISSSDGAILLLPTMAFYWFLLSLLMRKSIVITQFDLPSKKRGNTPLKSLYVSKEMPR